MYFDSLGAHFNSQLPPFVLAMNPFVLTERYGIAPIIVLHRIPGADAAVTSTDETVSVCRCGIDRADVEASRSMFWRLDTDKQVASFNEQKRTAYINLEYCYMQYCYGFRKGLNAKGRHSSFHFSGFREFGDMEEFAGRELWPAYLSKVAVEYQ